MPARAAGRPRRGPAARVGSSSGESWALAAAATRCSGRPAASVTTERLMPCLPRSTGERPETSPPQGDLVIDPSTDRSSRSSPSIRSYPASALRSSVLGDAALGPVVESAPDGPVRAARHRDPLVPAAVDQGGDHAVEHDPVIDPVPVTAQRVGRVELGTARRRRSARRTRPTGARSGMLEPRARTLPSGRQDVSTLIVCSQGPCPTSSTHQ